MWFCGNASFAGCELTLRPHRLPSEHRGQSWERQNCTPQRLMQAKPLHQRQCFLSHHTAGIGNWNRCPSGHLHSHRTPTVSRHTHLTGAAERTLSMTHTAAYQFPSARDRRTANAPYGIRSGRWRGADLTPVPSPTGRREPRKPLSRRSGGGVGEGAPSAKRHHSVRLIRPAGVSAGRRLRADRAAGRGAAGERRSARGRRRPALAW
jgi:hypothetical protein